MASVQSTLLLTELPATGEKINEWGVILNERIERLEEAITGILDLSLTGGSYTLDDTVYAQNEARYYALDITGTLTSNQEIIVPSRDKFYMVTNNTTPGSFTLTVKTAGGTGVVINQGTSRIVKCDSVNVVGSLFASLSDDPNPTLTASLNADSNDIVSANFVAYTEKVITNNAVTGTYSCDLSLANVFKITVIGDTAIEFSNVPTAGVSNALLYITQDGTGGHAVTFPSSIRWPEGSSPSLTTTANSTDILVFFSTDGGITIDAKMSNKDTQTA